MSYGLESKKASVYGRDYETDLDAYFNDVKLQQILALFGPHEFIQNAKHLSDIAGISEIEAMDKLECLKNLSLISVNDNGYFKKKKVFTQAVLPEKKDRLTRHSMRLMQIASLYPEAEQFCDDFLTFSTSEQLCRSFHEKITAAKNEFIAKSNDLKTSDQNRILTFGLGFLVNGVNQSGGAKND